ncbi:MAG: Exodeoxyribonuclease 7 small subunit [Chlamydiales bacterium]|nr:Exodeoxyribonuclease 7 small subunit [Chlamydiales bacterium]MCH9635819.1 Exodeoxyribonuclease 7 small subunit [Chlamydiales bacterium]
MTKFEAGFGRLEEILDKMNSGKVPLEESLKLYEEADKLLGSLGEELSQAEKKIEMLVKKRDAEPEKVPFE